MRDNRRVKPSWFVAVVAVLALVVGCSSSADNKPDTVPVPKGFTVPDGVTLTEGGTQLATGKPASVVYEVADHATSAITVTVAAIRKGSINSDFTFFSLDDVARKSTPFYVDVTVKNEGPAGLGGAALPLYVRDSSNTDLPANDIVGSFKPCRPATLPKSFLPGSTAKICLVYLVPSGKTLKSVNLQTAKTKDAITWKPSGAGDS